MNLEIILQLDLKARGVEIWGEATLTKTRYFQGLFSELETTYIGAGVPLVIIANGRSYSFVRNTALSLSDQIMDTLLAAGAPRDVLDITTSVDSFLAPKPTTTPRLIVQSKDGRYLELKVDGKGMLRDNRGRFVGKQGAVKFRWLKAGPQVQKKDGTWRDLLPNMSTTTRKPKKKK